MNLTRRRFGGIALGAVGASSVFNKDVFAQAAPTRLKFGSQFPAAHPAASRMAEACEEIKKETGGEIDMTVFPNTQLGGEAEMLSQLRSGALEFMTASGPVMQTLVPVTGINAVPYIGAGAGWRRPGTPLRAAEAFAPHAVLGPRSAVTRVRRGRSG
jgi:TRAP-type transport system periplasmic protein